MFRLGGNTQVPHLVRVKFGAVSCNRLWIFCIIWHHMQPSGISLEVLWVSLMVYDTSSVASYTNVLCECGLPMVEGLQWRQFV